MISNTLALCDLELASPGSLDFSVYPLNLLTHFSDTATVTSGEIETWLGGVEDKTDAIGEQDSADTLKMPFSPIDSTIPFASPAVSNQKTAELCPASSPKLSGLQGRTAQFTNVHRTGRTSEEKAQASRDLECKPHEWDSIDCTHREHPPQDFSLDDDPVMPKKSTADSCDTEFLKLVATLPESSEHNDVDKAIEKAKNPAVGSELASAGKSADTKSPGPMYSSPIVAIVRNSKRPATNRKRQPEDQHSDMPKRRRTKEGLTEEHSKPARSSRPRGNDVNYDMSYHPIDDVMTTIHATTKNPRLGKEQSGTVRTSTNIKSEVLKLNEEVCELLREFEDKARTLAARQSRLLDSLKKISGD